MADKEKPYKVYRGGRARGPIRPEKEAPSVRGDGTGRARKPPRSGRRWRRIVLLLLVGLVLLALVWALLGYLALRRGVGAANDRLDGDARRALTPAHGSILSSATNVLVLGADVGKEFKGRDVGRGRADSIMLVRTDPDADRVAYVSIPRDLRVEVPEHGLDKINSSYAVGGPALAVETVQALTGLEINHVVVVDFASFRDVIDAVGGITVDNPRPIFSNAFDCPFRQADRCSTFEGWRFRKGKLHLDGRRALVYARIRHNRLDEGESDITRGQRQQRVLQGLTDKVVGVGGFLRMPFIGDDLVEPLATDLSTGELLELAWVRWRAADNKTLRCTLGGEPADVGGSAVLQPSEDNALVIAGILDADSRPPDPRPGDPFSPACFTGRAGS
ncbi:MAG: LCP family protein [Thermoleophilia bacterium]|nr:LCP family protein [Thermoleophilia bacterium]MDQ3859298.1 LCP family protein [Actinomycetota bacterium]